jgi:low affinity Fe/Cu permease
MGVIECVLVIGMIGLFVLVFKLAGYPNGDCLYIATGFAIAIVLVLCLLSVGETLKNVLHQVLATLDRVSRTSGRFL